MNHGVRERHKRRQEMKNVKIKSGKKVVKGKPGGGCRGGYQTTRKAQIM